MRHMLILIFIALLFLGCTEQKTPEQKIVKIEEVAPSKSHEKISKSFLPAEYPWKTLKGNEDSRMYYQSYLPRKPEIMFKTTDSVYLSGAVPVSVPLVEKNSIFVGSKNKIYSINLDGEVVWENDVYDHFDRFVESYTLGRYFFVGTSSTSGGEGLPLLIAFDKESGEVKWQKGFGEKGSKVTSNMVVCDGAVFAGSVDGSIVCFSEEGEQRWVNNVDGIVRGLACGGGKIYVTTENGNKIYAFDILSGETEWIYDAESPLTTPLYLKGLVITSSYGELIAVKDGELLWRKDIGAGSDANGNSFIAASDRNIYAVSREKLYTLDLAGNVIGDFTIPEGEAGIPIATEDMVIVPSKTSSEAKIYLIWRGTALLNEIRVLGSDEVWMPAVSAGYGDIYVAVRVPDIIYRFGDNSSPVISNIKVEISNETLKVQTTVKDEESAIYRVLLFYSNDSEWNYVDMLPSRRYVMEPIGGYGLKEEPYEAEIPVKGSDKVELYIAAIDNVGNYAFSDVKGYKVVGGR